jgi:hypothetical protein
MVMGERSVVEGMGSQGVPFPFYVGFSPPSVQSGVGQSLAAPFQTDYRQLSSKKRGLGM